MFTALILPVLLVAEMVARLVFDQPVLSRLIPGSFSSFSRSLPAPVSTEAPSSTAVSSMALITYTSYTWPASSATTLTSATATGNAQYELAVVQSSLDGGPYFTFTLPSFHDFSGSTWIWILVAFLLLVIFPILVGWLESNAERKREQSLQQHRPCCDSCGSIIEVPGSIVDSLVKKTASTPEHEVLFSTNENGQTVRDQRERDLTYLSAMIRNTDPQIIVALLASAVPQTPPFLASAAAAATGFTLSGITEIVSIAPRQCVAARARVSSSVTATGPTISNDRNTRTLCPITEVASSNPVAPVPRQFLAMSSMLVASDVPPVTETVPTRIVDTPTLSTVIVVASSEPVVDTELPLPANVISPSVRECPALSIMMVAASIEPVAAPSPTTAQARRKSTGCSVQFDDPIVDEPPSLVSKGTFLSRLKTLEAERVSFDAAQSTLRMARDEAVAHLREREAEIAQQAARIDIITADAEKKIRGLQAELADVCAANEVAAATNKFLEDKFELASQEFEAIKSNACASALKEVELTEQLNACASAYEEASTNAEQAAQVAVNTINELQHKLTACAFAVKKAETDAEQTALALVKIPELQQELTVRSNDAAAAASEISDLRKQINIREEGGASELRCQALEDEVEELRKKLTEAEISKNDLLAGHQKTALAEIAHLKNIVQTEREDLKRVRQMHSEQTYMIRKEQKAKAEIRKKLDSVTDQAGILSAKLSETREKYKHVCDCNQKWEAVHVKAKVEWDSSNLEWREAFQNVEKALTQRNKEVVELCGLRGHLEQKLYFSSCKMAQLDSRATHFEQLSLSLTAEVSELRQLLSDSDAAVLSGIKRNSAFGEEPVAKRARGEEEAVAVVDEEKRENEE